MAPLVSLWRSILSNLESKAPRAKANRANDLGRKGQSQHLNVIWSMEVRPAVSSIVAELPDDRGQTSISFDFDLA